MGKPIFDSKKDFLDFMSKSEPQRIEIACGPQAYELIKKLVTEQVSDKKYNRKGKLKKNGHKKSSVTLPFD